LLHGDIWLDEAYDGGVEGSPGARFVIRLNTPPLSSETILQSQSRQFFESGGSSLLRKMIPSLRRSSSCRKTSILFVDDDLVLRKLFSRCGESGADVEDQELRTGAALRMVDFIYDFDFHGPTHGKHR
jgi:hypothetical protein